MYDGGSPIDYYIVYQDGSEILQVETTSTYVYGLQNGQQYEFSVAAHNQAGVGQPSESVVSIPMTVPGAPRDLSAQLANGQITLSWSPPFDDGGAAIDRYMVYTDGTITHNVTVTTLVISGLTNGQTYTFYVRAHNAAGDGAASSNFAVRIGTPTEPRNVQAISGQSQVQLDWDEPLFVGEGIDYYSVYQDGVDVKHVVGTGATITGLGSGATTRST